MNRLIFKKEIDVRVILKKSFKQKDESEIKYTEVHFLSDGEMCKATTSIEAIKEGKQVVDIEVFAMTLPPPAPEALRLAI